MIRWICAALLLTLAVGLPASADPCGLVPPIEVRDNPDAYLTRVGEQITYVFFKDGIEDIVLRPAFKGKVDEFGMLIPFPSPPAIRKVADDIFGQVAKAVDPPKVDIRLSAPVEVFFSAVRSESAEDPNALRFDDVRVLKEEAVGMYQVAVLEAGSPRALSRWMETHGYVYPEGMDAVVQDYVDKTWCFVAVKARVGQKRGVSPKPGMKSTTPDLPTDAVFSGAVQAMGFRFRVDEPVVPMRLSAYNPGRLHNIVYALTETGVRIKQLPRVFVKKTVGGAELHANVTEPLPARFHWYGNHGARTLEVGRGESPDLPKEALEFSSLPDIRARRDPAPHNGKARALFASDLLAARHARLSHPFEELQKDLLNVGEAFGLRGPAVDALIEEELQARRAHLLDGVLEELKGMTLTVIEGDFPRETLKKDDLTFMATITPDVVERTDYGLFFFTLLGVAAILGGIVIVARRRGAAALALLGPVLVLAPGASAGQDSTEELVAKLADPEGRERTMENLVRIGSDALPALTRHAADGKGEIASRGWATVCIARIGDASAVPVLKRLIDPVKPDLVGLWAMAAVARLDAEAGREICLAFLGGQGPGSELHTLLSNFVLKTPGLRDPEGFVRIMIHGEGDPVRRMAAGFLGSSRLDSPEMRQAVVKEVAYRDGAKAPPWEGGALFLPGVSWKDGETRALSSALIHWMLWAEEQPGQQQVRVVRNNLVSLLARSRRGSWNWGATGSDWAVVWAKHWGASNRLQAAELLLHALRRDAVPRRGAVLAALRTLAGEDHGTTVASWEAWVKILRSDK